MFCATPTITSTNYTTEDCSCATLIITIRIKYNPKILYSTNSRYKKKTQLYFLGQHQQSLYITKFKHSFNSKSAIDGEVNIDRAYMIVLREKPFGSNI